MQHIRKGLAIAILLGCASAGHAFTFADGSTAVCVVNGKGVLEFDVPEGARLLAPTGETVNAEGGYRINWNPYKQKSLPPEVRDYLFFHECAHAKVPTKDEVQANCVGLRDMRAAGRAGVAVEARLATFYGPGSRYWADTLQCANAAADVPK
jgi:hypothetical protein